MSEQVAARREVFMLRWEAVEHPFGSIEFGREPGRWGSHRAVLEKSVIKSD
jgi:hypothetical protein